MNFITKIDPTIFREYDLRGIYKQNIDENVAYTIGRSFATYIALFGETETLVGYDNRLSSKSLNEALIKGITDSGIDVFSLGLVTTPMYNFAKYHLKQKTGIMITASHNPKEYNGFKISFDEIGHAYGKMIYDFRDFTEKGVFNEGKGSILDVDIRTQYVNQVLSSIHFGERKPKVVIDCGNGTGSVIIKEIMEKSGLEYYLLYCDSDGTFPHHHPDPSIYENMTDLGNKVKELGYDLGFAVDGDADRVGVVDETGAVIPVDILMAILYRYMSGNLKQRKALFDVKCSKALIDVLNDYHIEPVIYRTGASYTNMMMKKGNFDFGGEYSGHLFFRDRFPGFDDGIYAGLRVIELLSHKHGVLSNERRDIPVYYTSPEYRIETTEEQKYKVLDIITAYVKEKSYPYIDIDGLRVTFPDGWASIRVSNTGPIVSARFEGNTEEREKEIEKEFMDIINRHVKKDENE